MISDSEILLRLLLGTLFGGITGFERLLAEVGQQQPRVRRVSRHR